MNSNMPTPLQDSIDYIRNISTLQETKPLIYLGLALTAFVYFVQRVVVGSRQKSRLPSRSPDPEKPTQTKLKAPDRPDGGKYRLCDCICCFLPES
jgi:hypothetical protein